MHLRVALAFSLVLLLQAMCLTIVSGNYFLFPQKKVTKENSRLRSEPTNGSE